MRHRHLCTSALLLTATLGCVLPFGKDDDTPPPPPETVAPSPPSVPPPTSAPPSPPPPPPLPVMMPGPAAQPWVAALPERRAVHLAGEEYLLAHRVSNDEGTLNEYIRPHETLGRWTRLIAVRRHLQQSDPHAAAAHVAANLQAQTPPRPHRVMRGDDGEYLLEFTTWNDDVVEINVFLYRRDPSGLGLLAHQTAVRSYRPDTGAFIARLEEERERLRDQTIAFTFPPPVE